MAIFFLCMEFMHRYIGVLLMEPSSDGLPSLISCFFIQAIKNPPVEEQEFDPPDFVNTATY